MKNSHFDFPVFDDFMGTVQEVSDIRADFSNHKAVCIEVGVRPPIFREFCHELGRSGLFILHNAYRRVFQ